MFRIVIRLAIAALVINAAWRVGTVYWRFYQFEDRLQEIAQFGERNLASGAAPSPRDSLSPGACG